MTTSTGTSTSPAIDAGTGLREGYAEVGDVTLHYVEAGAAPASLLRPRRTSLPGARWRIRERVHSSWLA